MSLSRVRLLLHHQDPEINDEFFDILFGHLRVGLVPEQTSQFRADYLQQGRGITEYRLALTLDEARQLWQTLDGQVARGLYWDMDYVNNGCTQVIFEGTLRFDASASRIESGRCHP